ncbi:MAG TPA: hypothetical protein VMV69_11590 [Pirellulales bacterium]|nr:hypothetical protein [Pirellulales bacterium]
MSVISSPQELRTRAFEVLVAQLGWVNAVRYVQQYEQGSGNYAHERDLMLPTWDALEIVRQSRNVAGSK